MIVDVEDGAGNVLEKSMVAANVGAAGTGDTVLVTTGSAARLPTAIAGMAIDASVIAIVDHLELSKLITPTTAK